MEHIGAFHRYQRNQGPISEAPSSKSDDSQNQHVALNNSSSSNISLMPNANLSRIMKTVLPDQARVSDGARDTIQECISEYISFITSEANEKCKWEHRKTVTAEDILWAMHRLGFDDYIEPLNTYLDRYRELEGHLRGSLKGEPLPRRAVHVGPSASPPMVMPIWPTVLQFGQHQAGPNGGGMGAYLGDGSGANPNQLPMGGINPFAAYK